MGGINLYHFVFDLADAWITCFFVNMYFRNMLCETRCSPGPLGGINNLAMLGVKKDLFSNVIVWLGHCEL